MNDGLQRWDGPIEAQVRLIQITLNGLNQIALPAQRIDLPPQGGQL